MGIVEHNFLITGQESNVPTLSSCFVVSSEQAKPSAASLWASRYTKLKQGGPD